MKKQDFIKGFKDGMPIGIGYLAVSFAFGIFAVANGLSVAESLLISMTNLTSAGQLAAVPIIAGGGAFIELVVAQLIINLRYALMSVSLSQKLDKSVRGFERFLIAFGNTDEIFAVAMSKSQEVTSHYMYGLILSPYLGWSLGTILGAVAGDILPAIIVSALGVAIYGMFVAIVVPVIKTEKNTALCVLLAVALSCAFRYIPVLKVVPSGFVIIICAVIASAVFAVIAPITQKEGN
ncbi:MAG: AzlC family ABC transporter permease [Oscillospiraceae bacterium]|nr:AzlC family ABC transporter permease [Oscillospiraceae bacterium]